jgi:hypothetical protein
MSVLVTFCSPYRQDISDLELMGNVETSKIRQHTDNISRFHVDFNELFHIDDDSRQLSFDPQYPENLATGSPFSRVSFTEERLQGCKRIRRFPSTNWGLALKI